MSLVLVMFREWSPGDYSVFSMSLSAGTLRGYSDIFPSFTIMSLGRSQVFLVGEFLVSQFNVSGHALPSSIAPYLIEWPIMGDALREFTVLLSVSS